MDLIDNYEHPDSNIIYIIQNIPYGKTADFFDEEFTEGCNCASKCQPKSCTCQKSATSNYILNPSENQTLKINEKLLINNWDGPIYECNKHCRCLKECENKLVQYGPRDGLHICETPNKGLSLMTKNLVPKGSFICEYAGEVLTEDEASKRHKENEDKSLMNYIFCIREHYDDKVVKHFVDPSKFGNIGRYINHSCEPNCTVVPIKVNNDIPKLCIFSVNDIPENSEITFSYGETTTSIETQRKSCLCMSKNCKKFIPFYNKI